MNVFPTRVYEANWITLCGTKYQPSLYVCHDFDEFPILGKIMHILMYEDKVVFSTACMEDKLLQADTTMIM